MIILGINDGHQSSAALIINGKLVAAVAEERFTRRKNEHGYPEKAIEACLSISGIKEKDIEHIAIATKSLPPSYFRIRRDSDFTIKDFWKEQKDYWYPTIYEKKQINYTEVFKDKDYEKNFVYDKNFIKHDLDSEGMRRAREAYVSKKLNIDIKKISFHDHHEAHAYYGLLGKSPAIKDCLIYTADGFGDGYNASVWKLKNNQKLENILYTNNCHIGRMYRYSTLLLGMKPAEHEYKVMGLAPYANPKFANEAYKVYMETLQVNGLDFKYNKTPPDNFFYFKKKLEGERFDNIAYAIQKRTEELITLWIKNGIKLTGIKNVIFSGGVAQNIKANKKVIELSEIESFYVPPGPFDESLSVGAAFMAHKKLEETTQVFFDNPYLGTGYNKKDISIFIKENQESNITVKEVSLVKIASLLAKGEIIGWFNGRMEFGSRALGARSIIANAKGTDAIKKINEQVKRRDFWMPFAPSILSYRSKDYIINPKNIEAKWMTLGFDSTELAQKDIKAALHPYDNTLRPNIVYKEDNKDYFNLITEFEKITGVGAILNTSFNLHGEPVVESPQDAYSTFKRCGLKYLYLCGYLFTKSDK